jgi:hypothetical protein
VAVGGTLVDVAVAVAGTFVLVGNGVAEAGTLVLVRVLVRVAVAVIFVGVREAVRVAVAAILVGVREAVRVTVGGTAVLVGETTVVGVRLGFTIGQIIYTDFPSVDVLICSLDSHVTVNAESGCRAIVCELDCLGREASALAKARGTAHDRANVVTTADRMIRGFEIRIILLLG